MLGKSLLETIPDEYELALTYHKNAQNHSKNAIWYHLDIRSRSDVFELFEIVRPDYVIHCASIGSVDYTEDHYEQVREVNVTGLSHIIDACNGYKSKLAYISTNAVYSGDNPPYNENSPLEPVNAYGIIKREAERLVRSYANKWLIFRPFMLYGWHYLGGRTNWMIKIRHQLTIGNEQQLVNDVIWQPTYAIDAAETIWKLLFQFDREIFNIASPERVTLYEFGLKVCEVFKLDSKLLKPIKTSSLSSLNVAKRPKDTTYDLIKLSLQGIILSDIKTGLEAMREAKE